MLFNRTLNADVGDDNDDDDDFDSLIRECGQSTGGLYCLKS